MKTCLPFSEIDKYLSSLKGEIGCLTDTSFLIAVADKDHEFHDDAFFIHEKLAEHGVRAFASVTARSEFIDYHRRVIVTETLMGMLAPTSRWRLSSSVKEILKQQKGWIDNQLRAGGEPILSDSRIKICKQAFLPKTQSGQIGWVELCREYLDGKLLSAWNNIVDAFPLHYVDMRAEDTKDLFRKELRWETMYRFAEKSAMGSNDAMILNLLDASVFPFVVTMDFDLAYGAMLGVTDKVAVVPDNLYRNRLKKLRF